MLYVIIHGYGLMVTTLHRIGYACGINNIAFAMAAVVGPKGFDPFDDNSIDHGHKIWQTNRSAPDDWLKNNNVQIKRN